MSRSALLLTAILAILLSGCTRAGISGAASMRVEVEVYKGPIGKSREIQIGELSALLSETVRGLKAWQTQERAVKSEICSAGAGKDPAPPRDCAVLTVARTATEDIVTSICRIGSYRLPSANPVKLDDVMIPTIDLCASDTRTALVTNPIVGDKDDPCKDVAAEVNTGLAILADTRICAPPTAKNIQILYSEYTRRVAIVTSQMQLTAMRLADSHVGYVPKKKVIRQTIASLNFLLGEMSNSIASRNSILQKLLKRCAADEKQNGTERPCNDGSDKLPTSDYLRDVEPTQFMEAFDWFNADLDSSGTGAMLRRNRTRAIKALTEDYYWEKVNEVYTSGQGDVSMAFIKDELGNWNLKSYTNDPSKLLAAYRGAANAALASAVKLARKAAGDPTALAGSSRALDLVDRLATGASPGAANIGGLRIDELKARMTDRLTAAKAQFAARETALLGPLKGDGSGERTGGLVAKLEQAEKDSETHLADTNRSVALAEAQKSAKQTALSDCPIGTDCPGELAKAIEDVQQARTNQATALVDQRKAQDDLAVARAEADQLGDRAAELADTILMEYQHDLSVLQQMISSESQAQPADGAGMPKRP